MPQNKNLTQICFTERGSGKEMEAALWYLTPLFRIVVKRKAIPYIVSGNAFRDGSCWRNGGHLKAALLLFIQWH